MNKKKIIFPVVLSLLVLGAGCSWTQTVNVNVHSIETTSNINSASVTNTTNEVTYAGVDGKNALELLQAGHQVDVSDQGFVNAIDGVKPGDHEYWAFYVNDQLAQVGAKDYQTKTGDNISWKLEKY